MFINISTDQIIVSIKGENYTFHRDDVEKNLGPTLVRLAKKHDFTDIVVINGPGGFTNLRVGVLCLNMLNTLCEQRFSIYSVDKISFYSHLVKKNFLPSTGIIYIGQKKNIWEYDFIKNTYQQVKKSEIIGKYTHEECFWDLVYDNEYFATKTITINGTGETINIQYNGKSTEISITELGIKPVTFISANYFIQPILGKQGQ